MGINILYTTYMDLDDGSIYTKIKNNIEQLGWSLTTPLTAGKSVNKVDVTTLPEQSR